MLSLIFILTLLNRITCNWSQNTDRNRNITHKNHINHPKVFVKLNFTYSKSTIETLEKGIKYVKKKVKKTFERRQ